MAETDRVFPEKSVIITDRAAYHLTITPFRHPYTNVLEHYTIGLGSRKEKCIQMDIPSIESGRTEGKLIWVEKIGPICYLDAKKDNKQLSQFTIQLAFTIARDINPRCLRYNLEDASSFPCLLPNKETIVVPMKPFYIAFHGGTWYEIYFNARLSENHDLYERLKEGRYDPSKKPEEFSFINKDLEEILRPIYLATNNWGEFFQKIQENFGDKKCSVVYPWVMRAVIMIFNKNKIFDDEDWYIDLKDNDKTPLIPFRTYEDTQKGGSKTRKWKRIPNVFNINAVYSPHIRKIQKFNYYKFLEIKKI
jgi:hypothetical protein